MIKNIHLRLTIIVFNILLLVSVLVSGYGLSQGEGSVFGHISWVSMFLFSLVLHIMLRKKRFMKMLKEAFQKESFDDKYDYHTLLDSLSQRSFKELSSFLDIKEELLQEIFAGLNINIKDFEESLNSIAKSHNYQEQKLFIIIIEKHLQTIKKENHGINANKFRPFRFCKAV